MSRTDAVAGHPVPELCVGAVVVDGDEILVVRRGRPPAVGRWSVPGGRVEPNETLAGAVTREVLEETGLTVACGPLLGWVERFADDRHFVILDFAATVDERRDPVAGDDAAEAAWVALDRLEELELVAGLAGFLRDHGVLAAGATIEPVSDPSTGADASR